MRSAGAPDAQQWIEQLALARHPEGGWFREIYRCAESIPRSGLPDRFDGDRSFATAIYFLLQRGEFSALHRIRQDELWHFYAGDALSIHLIDAADRHREIRLGLDVRRRQRPMAVVAAGCLFGAELAEGSSFALVGCTVAPGFAFDDLELPDRRRLLERYPQHRCVIARLTRPS